MAQDGRVVGWWSKSYSEPSPQQAEQCGPREDQSPNPDCAFDHSKQDQQAVALQKTHRDDNHGHTWN